jgi:hypothetical protein
VDQVAWSNALAHPPGLTLLTEDLQLKMILGRWLLLLQGRGGPGCCCIAAMAASSASEAASRAASVAVGLSSVSRSVAWAQASLALWPAALMPSLRACRW